MRANHTTCENNYYKIKLNETNDISQEVDHYATHKSLRCLTLMTKQVLPAELGRSIILKILLPTALSNE